MLCPNSTNLKIMDEQNKVRIAIAEDQKVIRIGLQEIIKQSSLIEIVAMAKDGKEVLEQVKRFEPDIVILDSIMPVMDGLETAKQLSCHYPNIKIIFISSSVEFERISKAIEAGAYGYLKKDNLENDLLPAILAVNRENVYYSPEIIPIIQEGQLNTEGYLKYHHLLLNGKPKSLVDLWELCLAKELISKWRFANKVKITPLEMLNILELENLSEVLNSISLNDGQPRSIIKNLQVVVKEIQLNYSQDNSYSKELLNKAEVQTKRWLDKEVLSHISSSAQKLRLSKIDLFNEVIASDWQFGSPEFLIIFFEELLKLLLDLRNKCEQNRVNCATKSNYALNSFLTLSRLVDGKESLGERQHLWKSAFTAIYVRFENEIKSFIYEVTSEIIVALVYCCQSYFDSLVKTNNLLKQVQTSLLGELEPELNALDSRSEIEMWLGHSLNQWGSSPSVSADSIKERLLSEIKLSTQLNCQSEQIEEVSKIRLRQSRN